MTVSVKDYHVVSGDVITVSVGGSPFTFTNPEAVPVKVYVNGTVTVMQVSHNNSAFIDIGLLGAPIDLNPGDQIKISYLILPSVKYYPG